ncbi:hypothetical protein, partial [Dyella sp. ASV21]|uniref:hypothetical protein n=1 Tax=Dyella sp. ASV21 TaxID=2795114 RepID=UPI0018ECEAB7
FLTTPEKLQQLNAALFAEVRTRYPALSADQWFSAVSGSYQAAMRYHEPTTAQRTLTVPAIWGNGAAPADLPAELWRRWQVPLQARAAEPFIVSMGEAQGCVTLVTRTRQGQALGQTTENGYDLYDRAVAAYPGCPSAGYELMRFGRVLGPDALAARDQYRGRVPHIRAITSPLDGSTVYVDLNAAGVQV